VPDKSQATVPIMEQGTGGEICEKKRFFRNTKKKMGRLKTRPKNKVKVRFSTKFPARLRRCKKKERSNQGPHEASKGFRRVHGDGGVNVIAPPGMWLQTVLAVAQKTKTSSVPLVNRELKKVMGWPSSGPGFTDIPWECTRLSGTGHSTLGLRENLRDSPLKK